MNKLQKKLIKNIMSVLLFVCGLILFLYLCDKIKGLAEVTTTIILGIISIGIFGCVMYAIIKYLIEDYKLRGILTEEEYSFYKLYINSDFQSLLTNSDLKELNRLKNLVTEELEKKE